MQFLSEARLAGTHKYEYSYQGNATITKQSPPEIPKQKRYGTNQENKDPTHETTDEQTKNNCNRRTALERNGHHL